MLTWRYVEANAINLNTFSKKENPFAYKNQSITTKLWHDGAILESRQSLNSIESEKSTSRKRSATPSWGETNHCAGVRDVEFLWPNKSLWCIRRD